MGRRSSIDAVLFVFEYTGRFIFPFGLLVTIASAGQSFRASSLYMALLMGHSLQDILYFYIQRLIKLGMETDVAICRMQVCTTNKSFIRNQKEYRYLGVFILTEERN